MSYTGFEPTSTSYADYHYTSMQSKDATVQSSTRLSAVSLGWFSFATTTLIFSLYNSGTQGVVHDDTVVSLCLAAGGLAQLLAGMWEYSSENTFMATVLSLYGSYRLSYGAMLLPQSGILSHSDDPEVSSALGIYFIAWTVITVGFLLVSIGRNTPSSIFFGILSMTLLVLTVSELGGGSGAKKTGGALGFLASVAAYYIAFADFLRTDQSHNFRLA
ncbi:hypothetical protein HGRIS_014436 [Hohenbuehelia grisea]|uniref:Uncharacterized protein n=1 Tax=Hohenbuehelia grisea TaxID=104357 RepID=A0ABR3JTE2_9AGAR